MDMNKKPTLLIMAAGLGSRFGGLKQITPVGDNGEIILDFSLYDAMRAGFEDVILVIKEEHQKDFSDVIDSKAGRKLSIRYAYQDINNIPEGFSVPEGRVKPWGTGHAVLSAKNLVTGPLAVINADDYYGPGAFKEMYEFLKNAEDGKKYCYSMVAYELDKTLSENGTVSRGVCEVSEDNKLLSIEEIRNIKRTEEGVCYIIGDIAAPFKDEAHPVSMNFWGFTPSLMEELETGLPLFLEETIYDPSEEVPLNGEYLLPEIVDRLIQEGKAEVTVLHSADKWFGVTYSEDLDGVKEAVKKMKASGLYPQDLWAD